MWELDYKENWVPKNWCFWTVVLEKTLQSSLLDCKEIKPVNPKENQPWKKKERKENQPWIFIGRTDAEAETPILWPPDAKNWLIWKEPDAGKDWRQEEKGTTEDEMVGCHHRLNGHESEQATGNSEGQGSLAYHHPSVGSRRVRLGNWTTRTQSCPLEVMGREPPCPGAPPLPGPGEPTASWSPASRSSQPWATLHTQSPH